MVQGIHSKHVPYSASKFPHSQYSGTPNLQVTRHMASRKPSQRSSTISLSSEKPIVRTPRPQSFNKYLLSQTNHAPSTCNVKTFPGEVTEKRRWTTTTQSATNEYALPTPQRSVPESTLEPFADPVRYRVRGTRERPSLWQQYSREWDMKQLRDSPKRNNINLPQISARSDLIKSRNADQFEERRPQLRHVQHSALVMSPAIQSQCISEPHPLFTRPTPGYGGFVPQYPVQPKPISDEDCVTACVCSTSQRSYRSFPPEEYRELTFVRRGPLSKTITLTAPFNPFNKVEQCEDGLAVAKQRMRNI